MSAETGFSTIRTRENSMLARLAAWKLGEPRMAIVLGRTVHLYGVSRADFLKNKSWVLHEMKHIQQFREHGFFTFIVRYTLESIRNGYTNNKYEQEARRAEKES